MRRLIMIFALLAAIPVSSMAQSEAATGDDVEYVKSPRIEEIKTELNLNEDQVKQVEMIHMRQRAHRHALRQDGLNQEEKEQFRQSREEENILINEVLNPEQRIKFEEMMATSSKKSKSGSDDGQREE